MSSIVGVVGIKVIVIVSRVTSRDKSVMEAVLVGTPAIVVMVIMTGMVVVTGVTGASPSMITVVVPAVVAVRIMPTPTVIETAVIVTV